MSAVWLIAWVQLSAGASPVGSTSDIHLVDVTELDSRWVLDIRYATTDNFTGQVLYPTARCLLRPAVAQMLVQAQGYLDEKHPGFVFRLKDCYRPQSVQRAMWEVVKGTPDQSYVANPYSKTGSVHNYGAAVDLTLNGPDGKEADMGTPYDSFQKLAQPRHEPRFLAQGKLTQAQLDNRLRLRAAMRHGGFRIIRNEWWHFDALQGAALRKRYKILDVPLDSSELPKAITPKDSGETATGG
ncbi:MAG: M15 family metallopeptidase [Myxococcota bacterium]